MRQTLKPVLVGLFLAGPEQNPSANEHRRTPGEKTKVPINPLFRRNRLVNVVNSEKMMVDGPFHNIENTKTQQQSSDQQFIRLSDVT